MERRLKMGNDYHQNQIRMKVKMSAKGMLNLLHVHTCNTRYPRVCDRSICMYL